MRDFTAVAAARFLSYFSRLRSVRVFGDLDVSIGEDNPLPAALALHDLHFLFLDNTSAFNSSWTSLSWLFASNLRQLAFRTYHLGADDLRFISVFAPTLEDLSISLNELDPSLPAGIDPIVGPPFPRLHTLALAATYRGNGTDGVWALLAGLATSPLRSLDLTTHARLSFKVDSPLYLAITSHRRTLRYIRYSSSDENKTLAAFLHKAIDDYCQPAGICFSAGEMLGRYIWGRKPVQLQLPATSDNSVERVVSSMEEVLRFAMGRAGALRRTKDREGVVELRRQMEGLNALKLAWED